MLVHNPPERFSRSPSRVGDFNPQHAAVGRVWKSPDIAAPFQ
jgi:hypothetical protein